MDTQTYQLRVTMLITEIYTFAAERFKTNLNLLNTLKVNLKTGNNKILSNNTFESYFNLLRTGYKE